MQTIESMINEFIKSSYKYEEKRAQKILSGDEKYSLIKQESLAEILDKNVI